MLVISMRLSRTRESVGRGARMPALGRARRTQKEGLLRNEDAGEIMADRVGFELTLPKY